MVTTTNIDRLESGKRLVYLVWEDLSVLVLKSKSNLSTAFPTEKMKTKKLLSDLNGYAEAGRILAIMGPSGSGKSTLLNALAGRLSQDVEMSGNVLINGKSMSTLTKQVSYVTQEDIFLQIFTVRETLTYSAHLRLPTNKMTKEEITKLVDNTMSEMGLEDCADNKIGSSWTQSRGLSSGEKKRLSIAIEILTNPNVLLLDEPTTGLDSASAFFVIRALKTIAMDGKIIILSIHQPSSDTFDLFDDLLLLSHGETVYFGERKMAIKFFGEAGFLCPTRRSPSDHFLRCISLDFDIVNATLMRHHINPDGGPLKPSDSDVKIEAAQIRDTLVENYKSSKYLINTRKKIKEIELVEDLSVEEESNKEISEAKWLKQLSTLTERSFLTMFRDIGYYWLRVICYAFVSIGIGSLYFNMGTDNQGIMARAKCVPFIFGFMICLSCGGLPFFFQELKVFHRERRNGHYEVAAFVVANFLSTFPFLVSTAVMSGTIIYHMVLFTPHFSHYCFFCINLFCCFALGEVYMITVASMVPNVMLGIGLGVGTIVLFMMASPMSRPLQDLPKIFWRYPMSYISCARWAIQGQYKNEMIGLEFDPPNVGAPRIKGEEIMEKVLGIPLDHSKWWDLAILICLLVFHRLLLFVVLKYEPKGSVLLNRIFSKRKGKQSLHPMA